MTRVAIAIALCAGCSSSGSTTTPPPSPAIAADAGAGSAATTRTAPAEAPPIAPRESTRPGRPIEIMLRSSPANAIVAVDGKQLGTTPQVWEGTTGGPHEFTFVLKDHAVARYRFVPVASGVVHARLEPIVEEVPSDAGVPPELARPAPPTVLPPVTPAIDAAVPATPPPPPPATGLGPQP